MSLWDALEKAAYTGLGLAAMTREKLDEVVDTLKKERGLTEDEGRRLADELRSGAESAKKKIDERVQVAVDKAMAGSPFASKKEIQSLEARIAELESRLNKEA